MAGSESNSSESYCESGDTSLFDENLVPGLFDNEVRV